MENHAQYVPNQCIRTKWNGGKDRIKSKVDITRGN